jgi:hypothetical protein
MATLQITQICPCVNSYRSLFTARHFFVVAGSLSWLIATPTTEANGDWRIATGRRLRLAIGDWRMLNFQGELPFAPTVLFAIRYSPFAAVFRPADLPTSRFADNSTLPVSLAPCPMSHSIVSQLPIHSMRDDVAW